MQALIIRGSWPFHLGHLTLIPDRIRQYTNTDTVHKKGGRNILARRPYITSRMFASLSIEHISYCAENGSENTDLIILIASQLIYLSTHQNLHQPRPGYV